MRADRLPTPARRLARRADDLLRGATATQRALPHFVVIGAQKSGTTSLYRYLADHPGVQPALHKEVHYFDLHFAEGEDWYRSQFPLRSRLGDAATGEASPYYLFHPLAPARAHALIPDAKLLVVLRDPVERAWSHYRHQVELGHETLSFREALDREPARMAAAEPTVLAGGVDRVHPQTSYVGRGRYAEQLERWFAAYPRAQVHVELADDLFADTATVYARVLAFLGLDPAHRPTFANHNARADSGLDPELRERLTATFRGPNEQLAALLGRTLPWAT